jgi:GMP synthase-like glutamine amidotransferase
LFHLAADEYFPDLELDMEEFDVLDKDQLPEANKFDACLITGSRKSVCDLETTPWMQKLADWIRVSEGQTKLIGICFGHQIIARAFGSRVIPNPKGYECGVVEIFLSLQDQELLQTDKQSMFLTASHYDIVESLPVGFSGIGKSSICDIQGMYKPGTITTQCHPELSREFWEDLIPFRLNRHEMTEATADFMRKSLSNLAQLDRTWYASRLLHFALHPKNVPSHSHLSHDA